MKGLLFTYALTYGGAAVSLYRPFYGLLVYICFAILRPEAMWYWSVPAGNYSRIVAIALLVGWVLNGCGGFRLGNVKPIVYCLVGFWIWALLSTLFSAVMPEKGYSFLEAMAKIILPFVVGATIIETVEQIKQLTWVIGCSVAYKAFELNQSFYAGFNRLAEYGFGGMDNNCVAIELVAAVGFMFFLFFAAEKWWQKGIAAASAALLVNAIMFSMSRGGMLALICTGLVSFLLIPKTFKHYVVFTAGVLVSLRLAGPQTIARFSMTFADQETRDESAQSRLDLWRDCIELMMREPLFGVGPDHFPYYAKNHLGWDTAKEAHSLWFQTGAELGFVGVGLLLAFYLICIRRLWPIAKGSADKVDPLLANSARMVIASLAGFFVSSQFVTLEGLELPYYVVLVGVGVIKVAYQPASRLAPHLSAVAMPHQHVPLSFTTR